MSKLPIGWITYFEENPRATLERAQQLGFDNIQAGRPGPEWESAEKLKEMKALVDEFGIHVTALFVAFKTEDYSTIAKIHETGGFIAKGEKDVRKDMALRTVEIAEAIGCPGIAAHLGFIPDDTSDPDHKYLVDTVGEIAEKCRKHGLKFSFETGQESAPTLKAFIDEIGLDNIGVNFDPANMILYGSGEPLEAIEILGPHLIGVHAKDAKWAAPDVRGKEWGSETPLGEGDVDFPKLIERILSFGYQGSITIEREGVDEETQAKDLVTARNLLENLL